MFKTGSQVPVMPDGIHYSSLCPAKAYVTETGKSSRFTTSSVFTSHCFHSAQSQTGRVFVVSGSHLAVPRAYPCLCAQGELLCSSGELDRALEQSKHLPLCAISPTPGHIFVIMQPLNPRKVHVLKRFQVPLLSCLFVGFSGLRPGFFPIHGFL